jgi:hypothetical protein
MSVSNTRFVSFINLAVKWQAVRIQKRYVVAVYSDVVSKCAGFPATFMIIVASHFSEFSLMSQGPYPTLV